MWADAANYALNGIRMSFAVLHIITALSTQQGVPHSTSYTARCKVFHGESVCLKVNASRELLKRSKASVFYMLAELSELALLIVSPSPW